MDKFQLVRKPAVKQPPRPPPMPLRGLPESHDAEIRDDRDWDFDKLFGKDSKLALQFGGAGGAAAQSDVTALERARIMFEANAAES